MKIYRLLVTLLVLLVVSAHANAAIYRGFESDDCTGDFLIAGNYSSLIKQDGNEDIYGKVWNFISYDTVPSPYPEPKCHDFNKSGTIVDNTTIPPNPNNVSKPFIILHPRAFPTLAGDFDAKANKTLLKSWQPATDSIEIIANWQSKNGATWDSKIPYEWNTEAVPPTIYHYGKLAIDEDPIEARIYAHNIKRDSQANGIPFEDFTICIQMEEHIHALQIKHLYDYVKDNFPALPRRLNRCLRRC